MQVYPTTLSELVCGVARYDGAKPVLIFADQPISYADLDMRIECAANSLALRGVVHGDRVALLIPNMPEFVVAYYAVLRCGGIVVPVNALYKAEEIAYILQDSEAKALILYAGFAAQGITGIAKAHLASQTIGYWRNPEATREALRDSWLYTGDIATIDEDGYYRIVDRKKDMINAGGFKVWPREVEEVLFTHPAVREAAVVAIPDPYSGERPLAYIALKEGQTATEEALITYCKEHLATFKVPCLIKFRDELPKLFTGKVLRRVLRDETR